MFWIMLAAAQASPEDDRITAHLERTLARLQAAEPLSLSPEQQAARAQGLAALGAYIAAGEYPANPGLPAAAPRETEVPGAYPRTPDDTPIFVDPVGTRCAVAALVDASGELGLLHEVVAHENTAWLGAMETPGLAEWVAGSGFSLEELASIQPSYRPEPRPTEDGSCPADRFKKYVNAHWFRGVDWKPQTVACMQEALSSGSTSTELLVAVRLLAEHASWEATAAGPAPERSSLQKRSDSVSPLTISASNTPRRPSLSQNRWPRPSWADAVEVRLDAGGAETPAAALAYAEFLAQVDLDAALDRLETLARQPRQGSDAQWRALRTQVLAKRYELARAGAALEPPLTSHARATEAACALADWLEKTRASARYLGRVRAACTTQPSPR